MSHFVRRNQITAEDENSWISVSDLMAGLMIIFLFIAIVYIRPVLETQTKIEEITLAWEDSKKKIYEALQAEFNTELRVWGADLNSETLSISFKSPDILFETGSAELRPGFESILQSFFPRYLSVLRDFEEDIAEIRIEGHTDRDWIPGANEIEAYFGNMALSQARTRSVLEYSFSIYGLYQSNDWARSLITANGLSFSQGIKKLDGSEDKENSRRVEFRIRTNADEKIQEIIERLK